MSPARIILAITALAAVQLACARADVAIEPATAPPTLPPSSSTPAPSASSTTQAAAPTSTTIATPAATPDVTIIPIPNGGFDADLSSWSVSDPRWVAWQAGYARLNVNGSSKAASIGQAAQVPAGSPVTLHFRYRSEAVETGPCRLESRFGEVLSFPADQQWREALLNYTGNAGQDLEIGVTGGSNEQCSWVDLDDFYWIVP